MWQTPPAGCGSDQVAEALAKTLMPVESCLPALACSRKCQDMSHVPVTLDRLCYNAISLAGGLAGLATCCHDGPCRRLKAATILLRSLAPAFGVTITSTGPSSQNSDYFATLSKATRSKLLLWSKCAGWIGKHTVLTVVWSEQAVANTPVKQLSYR